MGFGVYKLTDERKMYEALTTAIDTGYKLIDTATFYKNEQFIGDFLRYHPKKDDVVVTTKVWTDDMSYDKTLESFEKSYNKLKGKIDIILLHWPHPDKFLDGYRALERLYNEKAVKQIGVSNFMIHHLEKLKNNSNIKPFLNQIELHPKFSQIELRDYHKKEEIITQSWAPIAKARYLDNETLVKIAEKYGVSTSNVILKWHIENGIHPIPKSETPSRIIDNFNSQKLLLSEEDIKLIDKLNENMRMGKHPDEFPY